jgi:hypothetical protein
MVYARASAQPRVSLEDEAVLRLRVRLADLDYNMCARAPRTGRAALTGAARRPRRSADT